MAILVFNAGSSSLKFKLYERDIEGKLRSSVRGAVIRLGEQAEWEWEAAGAHKRGTAPLRRHEEAAAFVLERLKAAKASIEAIGHRLVHGGEEFTEATRLGADAIARLEALGALAPLHNPPALEVVRACRDALGERVPMFGVFDTAFHAALPETAYRYALPDAWVQAHRIRRYGFHGIAHRYMYERYLILSGRSRARVVSFQLGHGCSAAAVRDGRPLDTSMGYTPLEGLVMSTRCGDVDPGVILRVAATGVPAAAIETVLNHASGLLALSGTSADMRTLLAREAQGDARARLAIDAFCYRARKYLGAYLAALEGADAVLFGGGIGENAPAVRERICAGMAWCGLRLDEAANAAAVGRESRISAEGATLAAYVITVDEEALIAREVLSLLG